MNTNVYGATPNNMLPPTQQQQQQQLPPQQFMSQPLTTNYGSGTAGNNPNMQYNPTTTTTAMPSLPLTTGAAPPMLNGNYQQQLTTSMSGMAINPMKQPVAMPLPPSQQQQFAQPPVSNAGAYNNPNAYLQQQPTAPPSMLQQQQQQNNNINNNNPSNFASSPPPPQTQPQQQQPQQQTQLNSFANGTMPTTSNAPPNAVKPTNYPTPPVGMMNQMTLNSGNLQGLPHMPPKMGATVPPTIAAAPGPPAGFGAFPPNAMPVKNPAYPSQLQQQQPSPQQQQQPMMMPPTMNAAGMPPMPGQLPPQQQLLTKSYPPQPQSYLPQPGYQPQPAEGYPGQLPPGGRPGFNQPPGAPGNLYQQPGFQNVQPPQQQRRLDPDQMPNPIQVMIENQRNCGGAFVTNQAGLLPPLVTTNYVVQDQGNCSPRYVRSSLYTIPATADLIKTTALPFNLIVSPFARTIEGEFEPPIVDFGTLGPIRCNRCKAYMSPNMQFIDAGRRFQCLMCKVSTEVPTEYFQHLDHTGQRVDKYERPELVLGTYEFLATKDYCRNNTTPEVPAFIFVIDVSYNTIKSGLVHLLCSQIKEILKHLPVDQNDEKSKVRVGFITYNSSVHFYNIHPSLAQPQMMVVGDVQDMFMPLLNGFLCHPEESEAVIDALMEQIPKMFVDTKETETILYPAIQAGLEALKASNCTGKLLIFNSTLPIAEAPGKLKNREDRKLLGTDKEKTILTPQCSTYNQLGQECVLNGVSVDLFVFNNSYIDIATIGQVSRLTGGEVFKYTYFQADTDGKRLIEDIKKNVSRPIAFDAVMRVRTSTGIRATDFYGHFFMTNTTDVELASIDATKSIAVEIKHDDKLSPEENVYLQIALLYTSCSGQRRLRVLNLALRVSTTIADVFKACDLDAMMLFYAKQACFKLMELTPKQVKENVIHRSAQILACYRKHCTSPTSAGQLILPEGLKLLPLYVSCLLKNDAISGGSDMTLDERSYVIQFVLAMDLNLSVNFFYPRFIPLHNLVEDSNNDELPLAMRCTHEKMSEDGAYILENGIFLFVWLGQSLPQTFIQPLFGVQCTQQVNAERFMLNTETSLGQRIQNIIETIMAQRTRYMRITCVRQNDKLENVFRHFLVEDRGTDGTASYVDFLCHMHKEIKDLLS